MINKRSFFLKIFYSKDYNNTPGHLKGFGLIEKQAYRGGGAV
jgi:hypothetical protein